MIATEDNYYQTIQAIKLTNKRTKKNTQTIIKYLYI